MARAAEITRPYTNLKSYLAYKERGVDTLREHEEEISDLGDDDSANGEGNGEETE
jgi:hypothetical protein